MERSNGETHDYIALHDIATVVRSERPSVLCAKKQRNDSFDYTRSSASASLHGRGLVRVPVATMSLFF
jgi:hypothetical protein